MGTIASLVLSKGDKVTGSDIKENAMILSLREQGAQIVIGHNKENLSDVDYVVYSSAVKKDNPEIIEAERKKISILKRAELLAHLMDHHIEITVAGSHGKTTTTSMISHMLIQAGLEPTTAVGGLINGPSYHAKLGEGKYFVSEVDESDGSFLFFHPRYSIITNIDFEHVDYYHNWENILHAYRTFIEQTNKKGTIIACGDDEKLAALLSGTKKHYITYGLRQGLDFRAEDIIHKNSSIMFNCFSKGKKLGKVHLACVGKHNVLNALACICLGLELKIDFKIIQSSLQSFHGVSRRFQHKGCMNDIDVFDDYGHHPTEIKATLETAQALKKKRLITIFQPHRYSRTKALLNEFVIALQNTDVLIMTDIYAASEEAIAGVTAEKLCKLIQNSGFKEVHYCKKKDIVTFLEEQVNPGDLILTLGAGDIYTIGDQFLNILTQENNRCCFSKIKKTDA